MTEPTACKRLSDARARLYAPIESSASRRHLSAAISASTATCALLLKAGAWPMARDKWGELPSEVAHAAEVVSMLNRVDPRRNVSLSYQRPALHSQLDKARALWCSQLRAREAL